MSDDTFMGVPRSRISWAPTIDYERCDYCMECDDFCPHRVFARQDGGERKLIVANPNNCVVFCRACAKTCAPEALTFPEKKEVIALIKALREEEPDG